MSDSKSPLTQGQLSVEVVPSDQTRRPPYSLYKSCRPATFISNSSTDLCNSPHVDPRSIDNSMLSAERTLQSSTRYTYTGLAQRSLAARSQIGADSYLTNKTKYSRSRGSVSSPLPVQAPPGVWARLELPLRPSKSQGAWVLQPRSRSADTIALYLPRKIGQNARSARPREYLSSFFAW
jgi:hypothetical protein